VIRGEELQLFGATEGNDNAVVVMPGTHSKWAHLRDGEVRAFQTIVTGELFDVLLNNTLVGQLATEKHLITEVFTQAVIRGYESSAIISELFHTRSGVLLDELDPTHAHSYLSGLLIGNELREGVSIQQSTSTDGLNAILIGSDELCKRYELAFKAVGLQCSRSESSSTQTAFAALLAMHTTL